MKKITKGILISIMPVLLVGCSWDDLKASGILGPSAEEHDAYVKELVEKGRLKDSILETQKCDSIEDVK